MIFKVVFRVFQGGFKKTLKVFQKKFHVAWHSWLPLCERSIRAARNVDLWGEGDNPIGSSLLTFEELSSIVARLIVKILPRYDLS